MRAGAMRSLGGRWGGAVLQSWRPFPSGGRGAPSPPRDAVFARGGGIPGGQNPRAPSEEAL